MAVGEQLLEAGANTDSRERVRVNGMRFLKIYYVVKNVLMHMLHSILNFVSFA